MFAINVYTFCHSLRISENIFIAMSFPLTSKIIHDAWITNDDFFKLTHTHHYYDMGRRTSQPEEGLSVVT